MPGNLVLGFFGSEEMNPTGARALIKDFVAAYRKINRGAEVKCLFCTGTWSDTMQDLGDYAVTSGYQIGLVGKEETWAEAGTLQKAVGPGDLIKLTDSHTSAWGLVWALRNWKNRGAEARLILVDGSEGVSDESYEALEQAVKHDIPIRSLPKGLDLVLLEEGDETEVPRDEDDDLEYADEDDVLDEEDDEEEIDIDDEEDEEEDIDPDLPDDDDDDDDVEEDEDEVEDEEDDEPEAEEAEDDEEDEEEEIDEEEEDEAEDLDETDDESEEDEEEDDEEDEEDGDPEEEEEAEEQPTRRAKVATGTKYTERELTKLITRDRASFLAVAAKYDVFPGRGLKDPTLVNRVLEAQNGHAPKPVAAVKKKVTSRPAAAPAKKAARPAPVAETRRPKAAAAPAGHTSRGSKGSALVAALRALADVLEGEL